MFRRDIAVCCVILLSCTPASAADQTQVGAGNLLAQQIGNASPLVQSAVELLEQNARRIQDADLRAMTLDSFLNPQYLHPAPGSRY